MPWEDLGAPIPTWGQKDQKKSKKGAQFGALVGAIWELFGDFSRFEKWLFFLCGSGAPFPPSWEAQWPPSAVNSSKKRGRTFCAKVRFLSDFGPILRSFGGLLGAFWRLFGRLILRLIFGTLFDRDGALFWVGRRQLRGP